MFGHKTYKDGVLQGVLVAPVSGETHEVRFVGTPMDLCAVAQFLGLEPVDGSDINARDDIAVMELQDGRGGYATLQPVDRASDLLHTVAEMTHLIAHGSDDPEQSELAEKLRDRLRQQQGDGDDPKMPWE